MIGVAYYDKKLSLLEKGNSISVYSRTHQLLVIEIFKVYDGFPIQLLNGIFHEKQ